MAHFIFHRLSKELSHKAGHASRLFLLMEKPQEPQEIIQGNSIAPILQCGDRSRIGGGQAAITTKDGSEVTWRSPWIFLNEPMDQQLRDAFREEIKIAPETLGKRANSHGSATMRGQAIVRRRGLVTP